MTAVLEATGIFAGYDEVEILHGVSVSVAEGEMVAVIGPNGAGKSTLLKAVFGLIHVREGNVRLDGRDITNDPPHRVVELGMSYVPQVENVFPSLTVRENLEMGAYARRDGLAARLDFVLQLFPDLGSRPNQKAGQLSGGQRQMLALGRALMLEPSLLLLDEPSASLSPKMVGLVFEKIVEINRGGTAVLLVEQNAREALSYSQRAYVLAMGENRLEGPAAQLLASEDVGRVYLGV